jgi:hypothetical protein
MEPIYDKIASRNARNARNAIKFAAIFATNGIAFDAPEAAASMTFTSFL